MITLLKNHRVKLEAICRRYRVCRLDVFGSAALGVDFDEATSDLDFLVEFERTKAMGPADQYFGLLESLTELFGRKIDLVTAGSLRNPYFIESVNETRQTVYAS